MCSFGARPATGSPDMELPGGTVETGESLERALTRELQEEAGLAPLRPPTLISTAHRRSPRGTLLHEHTFQVETGNSTTRTSTMLPACGNPASRRQAS